jgi:hypothetical protein
MEGVAVDAVGAVEVDYAGAVAGPLMQLSVVEREEGQHLPRLCLPHRGYLSTGLSHLGLRAWTRGRPWWDR